MSVLLTRQSTGGHDLPLSRQLIPNVLMIGTGEYTTGYVHGMASDSDKGAGVVALTMFDLRRRGKVGRLGLAGVNGKKYPGIRAHMKKCIEVPYKGISTTVETFPRDNETNPNAYLDAIGTFTPGDAVTIFTPDDTHFKIALACIKAGLHVLVTKPVVKTLEDHRALHEAAVENNVLVAVEVHKRWDPIYVDSRDRIQALGPFSYMYSYMSQPKHQLNTFKAWAGKSSDISYYLNSHHIDFHEWCVGDTARPISVMAAASTGLAKGKYDMNCEDTITLTVVWENLSNDALGGGEGVAGQGTAVYTSSWIAPRSDVHSQQRFFYMGQGGEVNVDQAHRGYNVSKDGDGYRSINPLFMKYTPSDGCFSGQSGYGYKSFEVFIDAVTKVNAGEATIEEYAESLASISTTYRTTAILEAGRMSLDENCTVYLQYADAENLTRPTGYDTRK
jgi:D-galacturonate reductase